MQDGTTQPGEVVSANEDYVTISGGGYMSRRPRAMVTLAPFDPDLPEAPESARERRAAAAAWYGRDALIERAKVEPHGVTVHRSIYVVPVEGGYRAERFNDGEWEFSPTRDTVERAFEDADRVNDQLAAAPASDNGKRPTLDVEEELEAVRRQMPVAWHHDHKAFDRLARRELELLSERQAARGLPSAPKRSRGSRATRLADLSHEQLQTIVSNPSANPRLRDVASTELRYRGELTPAPASKIGDMVGRMRERQAALRAADDLSLNELQRRLNNPDTSPIERWAARIQLGDREYTPGAEERVSSARRQALASPPASLPGAPEAPGLISTPTRRQRKRRDAMVRSNRPEIPFSPSAPPTRAEREARSRSMRRARRVRSAGLDRRRKVLHAIPPGSERTPEALAMTTGLSKDEVIRATGELQRAGEVKRGFRGPREYVLRPGTPPERAGEVTDLMKPRRRNAPKLPRRDEALDLARERVEGLDDDSEVGLPGDYTMRRSGQRYDLTGPDGFAAAGRREDMLDTYADALDSRRGAGSLPEVPDPAEPPEPPAAPVPTRAAIKRMSSEALLALLQNPAVSPSLRSAVRVELAGRRRLVAA